MIGELDLSGVFLSPVLISAVIALVFYLIIKQVLMRIGAYRVVIHPALVDASLFVITWAIVATFPLPEL